MERKIRRGLLGCPVQSFCPLGSLTNSRQTLRSLVTYRPGCHSWSPLVMKQDDHRASPPSRTRPPSGDSREPPVLGPPRSDTIDWILLSHPEGISRAKASICFMTQLLMQIASCQCVMEAKPHSSWLLPCLSSGRPLENHLISELIPSAEIPEALWSQ